MNEQNESTTQPSSNSQAKVAEQLQGILDEREQGEAAAPGPLDYLTHIMKRSAELDNGIALAETSPENIMALQSAVTQRLGQQGRGEYADIRAVVEEMGPRLFQGRTLDNLNLSPESAAMLASMVVLVSKPDDLNSDQVPKLKQESNEYAALRSALTYLRAARSHKVTTELHQDQLQNVKLRERAGLLGAHAAGNPSSEAAQSAYREALANLEASWENIKTKALSIDYANEFLAHLRGGELSFSKQAAIDALGATPEEQNQTETLAEAIDENWVILPPEHTGADVQPRAAAAETDGQPPEIRRYREERIAELHKLVADWGEGYVVESRFRGAHGDKYYVAVLPHQLDDGTPVEHAVVDNPLYGNSRFIWRADRGATNDAGESLTWRVVFSTFKSNARAMGAIPVNHRGDWESRTLGYLTSPIDELPE